MKNSLVWSGQVRYVNKEGFGKMDIKVSIVSLSQLPSPYEPLVVLLSDCLNYMKSPQ